MALPLDEKIKSLWRAHQEKDNNTPFAEARIYSEFHTEWFEECEPDPIELTSGTDSEGLDIEF